MARWSLVLLVVMACGSEPGSREPSPDSAVTDAATVRPPVSVLGTSQQSGWEEPVEAIVANDPSWTAAWAYQHDGVTPPPPRPDVDFEVERVLMVAAGMRTSGGFDLQLSGHAIVGDTLTVDVLLTTPGAECAVTMALTSPALALRIPRQPETVVVRRTERAGECAP